MKKPTQTKPDAFSVSQLALAFDCDRRTVTLALMGTKPAATTKTGKRYSLVDAAHALERYRAGKNSAKVREPKLRQIELKNQKLEEQVSILRRERIPVATVEKWGGEIGAAVRKVVTEIHRIAPSVVGISIQEAEARLKELEQEIHEAVDGWKDKLQAFRNAHEQPR